MKEKDPDYSKMTQEDFDDTLDEVVYGHGLTYLYGLEGVWEIASDHFHNDVLDRWAEQHPDLAYPAFEEDECEEQEDSL